jgi:hypothetical protein
MATVKHDFVADLLLNKHAELEHIQFKAGQSVDIMQTWDRSYLIKDADGHFYNVGKDKLDVD